ncbi:MAG: LytTR family DNA-binding domain-containing protein [Nibricoccus sp.]
MKSFLRPASPLRVLIADDDAPARQRLRTLLSGERDLKLIAECADGADALEALRNHTPDVALLDIDMPGLDGLEVIRSLPADRRPAVIFITAHGDRAHEAFDVQAVDYLLKPFKPARLRQALARVAATRDLQRLATGSTPPVPPASTRLQRVIVRMNDRMIIVPASDIDWVESAGNYAVLHVRRETHVVRETLTELEARLAEGQFLRISRGVLVNLERVRELQTAEDASHVLVLSDGTRLAVTRPIREVQARLESG